MSQIPDFQIVGATKCGTSTLHHWLSQHPEVSMSRPKETPVIDRDFQFWEEEYKKYLPNNSLLKGDANPNLLVIPWAAERIKITNPNAKIIICERNPIERCYSHWSYFKNMRPGREPLTFVEAIELGKKEFDLDKFKYEGDYITSACKHWGNYKRMYLESGFYRHFSKNFTSVFEEVIFVPMEFMREDPQGYIDTITDFLSISRLDLSKTDKRVRNVNRKKEKMSIDEFNLVHEFYSEKGIL